jgi:hypothetical protein
MWCIDRPSAPGVSTRIRCGAQLPVHAAAITTQLHLVLADDPGNDRLGADDEAPLVNDEEGDEMPRLDAEEFGRFAVGHRASKAAAA